MHYKKAKLDTFRGHAQLWSKKKRRISSYISSYLPLLQLSLQSEYFKLSTSHRNLEKKKLASKNKKYILESLTKKEEKKHVESLKKRKIEEKKEIVQPKIKYEEIQEPQELQRFEHY